MSMKLFDPIRLFKEISIDLLEELLTSEGVPPGAALGAMPRTDATSLLRLWDSLSAAARAAIQIALHEVHVMSQDLGLRVLAEQLEGLHPEYVSEFSTWESRVDKALWARLHARAAFEEAMIFARADSMAEGRHWNRWNGLPPRAITVTEERTARLQEELQKYYWPRELRGQYCRVHHYSRANGINYFFAYLDNWPDQPLAFDEKGEMESRSARYAFANVFAYDSERGCIDLVAPGGRKLQARLRRAFCRSVLELEVEDEPPLRPVYRLDHLLDPHSALSTDPADRIAHVRICRIRVVPRVPQELICYEEFGFMANTPLEAVRADLRERFGRRGLSADQFSVSRVAFQLQFHADGRSRPRTMSFFVSAPNSCDLKSKSDEMRAIGERCLRLWGIVHD